MSNLLSTELKTKDGKPEILYRYTDVKGLLWETLKTLVIRNWPTNILTPNY
jgi:hypothetical protein